MKGMFWFFSASFPSVTSVANSVLVHTFFPSVCLVLQVEQDYICDWRSIAIRENDESLTYLCHGNFSFSSMHPTLKVNIENCYLTTALCVSFVLSSGDKKRKRKKKLKKGGHEIEVCALW